MTVYPLVERDDASADFFQAAEREQLQMKRGSSGVVLPPYARVNPGNGEEQLHPLIVSGDGTLVSWSVVRQAPHPALAEAVPYISAVIELVEGPWLIVRLLATAARPSIGAPVRARFERTGSESHYGEVVPVFEILATGAGEDLVI